MNDQNTLNSISNQIYTAYTYTTLFSLLYFLCFINKMFIICNF